MAWGSHIPKLYVEAVIPLSEGKLNVHDDVDLNGDGLLWGRLECRNMLGKQFDGGRGRRLNFVWGNR